MPLTTVGRVTTLWSKTDWVITDINGGNVFLSRDGTKTLTANSSLLFDCRLYRGIICYMVCGGLTGGTTPTVNMGCNYFDDLKDFTSGSDVGVSQMQTIPAAGGKAQLLLGDLGAPPVSNTGVAYVNAVYVTVSYLPIFAQFYIGITGGPTGLTSLRTFIYGVT